MTAKITDVKAYPLKTRTALVRVFTDAGVDGVGECSPMNVPVMCHFVEAALRPIVLGRDALDTERLWDTMYYGTHKLGTSGVQPSCIAGVDIALWDIKGKLCGQPLYRLLGGAVRTTFTMYKSIGGGGAMAPAQMLERVEEAWDQGFRAFKIRMDWQYRQDVDPGLPGLGVSVHSPPAPHNPLDVGGRAGARHRQQPLFRLQRGHAGQRPDLGVRELPAGEGLGQPRKGSQGARHADLLSGRTKIESHSPAQPGGAGAESAVPAPAGVKLADQVEQASGGGLEVCRQLGDLVAQSVQLRDTVRGGENIWRMDLHGASLPSC